VKKDDTVMIRKIPRQLHKAEPSDDADVVVAGNGPSQTPLPRADATSSPREPMTPSANPDRAGQHHAPMNLGPGVPPQAESATPSVSPTRHGQQQPRPGAPTRIPSRVAVVGAMPAFLSSMTNPVAAAVMVGVVIVGVIVAARILA
jgi:hypothetical protein